ncbi:MAG: succinate dehydrogenase assembly factor 2 [Pseudomonadota bacterium]
METPEEIRIKRLRIRAWRRGTKEMDLLLGNFIDARGQSLGPHSLDALEALMEENDNDLYRWVSGQVPTPPQHEVIVQEIQRFHAII